MSSPSTLFLLTLLLISAPALAGPQGGAVIDGAATIGTAGRITTINQSTSRAIINWQRFESTATETIRFNQPGVTSLTLNRVIGIDPSFLGGALQANGRLFIINPNGIVFGPNAQVNVSSLVASSMNITDDDFKNNNFQFLQGAGELSSVINRGRITAGTGGTVALLAPIVDNSGTIVAAAGRVILVGALSAGIDAPAPPVPRDPSLPPSNSVGRNVRMATIGLTPLLEDVVNTQSTRTANQITRLSDGTTFLRGAGGIVVNGGTIDVSKPAGTAQVNGTISVSAERAIGLGAGSRMISGTTGGGGTITADAATVVFSPAGGTGRAILEADQIDINSQIGGVKGDADGSIELRGGKASIDAFGVGTKDTPVRVNTDRIKLISFNTVGIISDGDLTADFLFVAAQASVRAGGAILAGTGGSGFFGFAPGESGIYHIFGVDELVAGDRIGDPSNPLLHVGLVSGIALLSAPNGTFLTEKIPIVAAFPVTAGSVSLDDSTPLPRPVFTPPVDAPEAAPEAGAIAFVGGAPAGGAAAGVDAIATGSVITVSAPSAPSDSSGGSGSVNIGARDNVLVATNRSATVKGDDRSSDNSADAGDVLVVKNGESVLEEDERLARAAKKRGANAR